MSDLPLDHAGRALEQWRQARPELDMSAVAVLARIRRLSSVVEPLLEEVLDRYGLNHAGFDTLSVLRRSGEPYSMTVGEIAEQCMRTPATLTARIARLERDGLVVRTADPQDGRASIIGLTDDGRRVIDEVAPAYLEVEKLVLGALEGAELDGLAQSLQKLLLSFEGFDTVVAGGRRVGLISAIGLGAESLHRSAILRRSVGLPDRQGMLVAFVAPESTADRAGVRVGDLLIAVDGEKPTSTIVVNDLLARKGDITLGISRGLEPDREIVVSLAAQ